MINFRICELFEVTHVKNYLQQHIESRYLPEALIRPGLQKYRNYTGWEDFYIGRHLVFSHRRTDYSASMFPEKLHSHRFFEMDIYITGQISYISDDQEMLPHKDDILLVPPGCMHTARLLDLGPYERYVFYFSPQFFSSLDILALPAFFAEKHASFHHIKSPYRAEFYYLLEKLKSVLRADENDAALLAYSYVTQLFHLIANHSDVNSNRIADIPENVRALREYVDCNFQLLNTVSEIAQHFYYSREYVSRIFKQYYNLQLSEYLVNRKVDYAKNLLKEGKSVTFAFDSSGFHSMSSFINAFRARTGMTPSEYKRSKKK